MALLRRYRIDALFDVGANAGQYASTMRALGFEGRIVSFEPSSEAYRLLTEAARRDPHWETVQCALGERSGTATLHVSRNSQSSSLLPMLPSHLAADPASGYVTDETVEVATLADQIDTHLRPVDRLFVKIDTQGSELEVLRGAGEHLSRVVGIQVELSLVPLYDGQPLIEGVIETVRDLGYVPMSVEPDFYDPTTGQLLQADGIFFRSDETGALGEASGSPVLP